MSAFTQAKGYEATAKIWENRRVSPFWAIFCKNLPTAQYNGNDYDEAEEKLQRFFEDTVNGDGASVIYEFRTYAEQKNRYDKKDAAHSTFFFSVSDRPVTMSGVNNPFPASDYFLQNIDAKLNELTSKINALEAEKLNAEDEDEDEDEEQVNQLGIWKEILSTPIVSGLIGAVTDKLLNVKTDSKIITNLAGVPDENERAACYQYVEILLQKGVKPEHLKKLAEMPAVKIKSLLLML